MRRTLRTVSLVALSLVMSAPLVGCATNAATGKLQFNSLSREQEISLGEEAMPGLVEGYGGEVRDDRLRSYVSAIGMELALNAEEEYRDIPWEFVLLDSEVINAFALPGGKVFVSRGLMERMTNESQLAAVLGHEVAHVTAEHADQQVSRQMIISGIAIGATVAAGTQDSEYWQYAVPAIVGGAGLFNLKFGRDEESEADTLGMRYMTRAGYNPRGMLELMEILRDASGGGGGQLEILATHPLPDTRIRRVTRILEEDYARQVADPNRVVGELRFQREILPMLRQLSEAGRDKPLTDGEKILMASTNRSCWCAGAWVPPPRASNGSRQTISA
ncbi:MAG: M48 family metalloprotease, partial [Planctomycetota bacterium]